MKILAGIVTYNPNEKRLLENIGSIINQVNHIIIIDNHSLDTKILENIKAKYCKVSILYLKRNYGIAYALKQIMSYAQENMYEWVITLDQDSVCANGLVYEYTKYIQSDIGAMTCNISDRNFKNGSTYCDSITEISSCITSACFMNVEAYMKTDGYDEKLFIDCVDFDICYSLQEVGYKIIRIPYDGLLHEIGKARDITFCGRKTSVFNHPAWRRYYASRNMIYLAQKHPQFVTKGVAIGRVLYRTAVIFFYEKDKIKKLKYNIKGLLAGFKMDSIDCKRK